MKFDQKVPATQKCIKDKITYTRILIFEKNAKKLKIQTEKHHFRQITLKIVL